MLYKEIKLSQGKSTIVDADMFDFLNQWKWSLDGRGYAARAITVSLKKRKVVRLHRLITNAPDGMDVDHVDGDPLNNCKSNLRVCSRTENLANASKRRNVTSKHKGVYWDKQSSKWAACLSKSGVKKFIGHFKEESDAATAYNLVAAEYFGEFAKYNKAS